MTSQKHSFGKVELFKAIETRDNVLLRRWIAARKDLNERGDRNRTPLHMCVWDDNLDAARLLLEAGADINTYDDLHDTPFLLCGAEGRVEIMKHMLKCAKPDLSLLNRHGGTALIPACERGHLEMVKMLIGAGVNVNQVNNAGRSGLVELLELGGDDFDHVEITKALIAAGASVNIKDKEGHTPLFLARKYNFKRITNLLEKAGGRE